MKKRFSTLIFDLDGTLVNTLPDIHKSLNTALKRLGKAGKSLEVTKNAVGPGKEAFMQAILPESTDEEEIEFLKSFREIYWEHCLDKTHLFLGMEKVLDHFKDKILAIATNKPRVFVEKILKGTGIYDRFHLIVGPDDVSYSKPHPEMIFKVLAETGSKTPETVFIGDTLEDMRAGLGANVSFCRAQYGYGDHFHLESSKPDWTIKDPVELMQIIS